MHDTGNLLTRDDTFFGVCEGLGEDLGFSPQYLRVALAIILFFNPLAMIGLYAALAVVVVLARWVSPVPRAAEPAAAPAAPEAEEREAEAVPLAA
ncbi:MAG TPA: PspC domain-containing protein [Allosphingosinicella sp.]|jgi:phage shock protein PspC (stress-responsive transcriptional regulator)